MLFVHYSLPHSGALSCCVPGRENGAKIRVGSQKNSQPALWRKPAGGQGQLPGVGTKIDFLFHKLTHPQRIFCPSSPTIQRAVPGQAVLYTQATEAAPSASRLTFHWKPTKHPKTEESCMYFPVPNVQARFPNQNSHVSLQNFVKANKSLRFPGKALTHLCRICMIFMVVRPGQKPAPS